MSILATISNHALLPDLPDWGERISLTLRWSGEEETALRGNEERQALRTNPRGELAFETFPGTLQEARALEARMRECLDQHGGRALVPVWVRPIALTAPAGAGDTSIDIVETWRWQVGDPVFAQDPVTGALVVRSVTGYSEGTLLISAGFGFAMQPGLDGDRIMPGLFGQLQPEAAEQWDGDLHSVRIRVTGTQPWRTPDNLSPTTTLSRPVLTIPADWANSVSHQLVYQQRAQELGAQTVLESLQRYVVHALSLPLGLQDMSEVLAVEALACAVVGTQQGWWLPSPERVAEVAAAVDSTHADIVPQGLVETFPTEPGLYVWCVDSQQTLAAFGARVTAVAVSGGYERLTFSSATPQSVSPRWDLARLRYVRLSKPEVVWQHDSPDSADVTLSLVELPHEYAAVDLGVRPATLFEIIRGGTTWRWTTHDASVTVSGNTYTPGPIEHGEITETVDGRDNGVQVRAWRTAGGPLTWSAPFAPEEDIWVKISRYDLQALGTPETLYAGWVDKVALVGDRVEATVTTRLARLSAQVPGFLIQRRDNFPIYSAANGISRAARTRTATVAAVSESGRVLRLTATGVGSLPVSYHLFGEVQSGTLYRQIEAVTIVDANNIDVRLEHPFPTAPAVSASVSLTEGYDASPEAAATQFSNLINFGGHPKIDENLALKAIELKSGGGKK